MENLTEARVFPEVLQFTWLDYTLFSALFGISLSIGVYFGCFGIKKETIDEYLFGGRSMAILPVALSLASSHVSGTTLLGLPSEIYLYGSQYTGCVLAAVACPFIIMYVYLPVFYKLQIMSSYEYLKLRFNGKIRSMASLLFVISTLLHTPLVIYIPALAFNQVSGMNIHQVTPIICALCIFYTSIGGVKAVVWSDTIQFFIILASTIVILYIGASSAGGLINMWKIADEGGRVEFFNMDLDPTARTTFWGINIGLLIYWVANFGVNPSSVQRFLSVPSLTAAKRSVFIFIFGVILLKSISCLVGFVMYARYVNCDPLTTGQVKRNDQLLPFYILDVARSIPGLAGLFISGVFSAALSTMSTNMNTLAGTIFEDFVVPWVGPIPEKRSNHILKLLVIIIGAVCVLLVFFVENLGGVVQMSISFSGVSNGPLLGLFTLGMFFKSANAKGALAGSITSLVTMAWIIMGNQFYLKSKKLVHPKKSLSIDGCDPSLNITSLFNSTSVNNEEVFYLYRISFYWYVLIGAIIVILVALPVSWLTKSKQDMDPDLDLLTPVVRWYYAKNEEKKRYVYNSVNLGEDQKTNRASFELNETNSKAEKAG